MSFHQLRDINKVTEFVTSEATADRLRFYVRVSLARRSLRIPIRAFRRFCLKDCLSRKSYVERIDSVFIKYYVGQWNLTLDAVRHNYSGTGQSFRFRFAVSRVSLILFLLLFYRVSLIGC